MSQPLTRSNEVRWEFRATISNDDPHVRVGRPFSGEVSCIVVGPAELLAAGVRPNTDGLNLIILVDLYGPDGKVTSWAAVPGRVPGGMLTLSAGTSQTAPIPFTFQAAEPGPHHIMIRSYTPQGQLYQEVLAPLEVI